MRRLNSQGSNHTLKLSSLRARGSDAPVCIGAVAAAEEAPDAVEAAPGAFVAGRGAFACLASRSLACTRGRSGEASQAPRRTHSKRIERDSCARGRVCALLGAYSGGASNSAARERERREGCDCLHYAAEGAPHARTNSSRLGRPAPSGWPALARLADGSVSGELVRSMQSVPSTGAVRRPGPCRGKPDAVSRAAA